MYGNNIINTTLTLPKILNGISKTIGIVNQAIPIYQEAKPLLKNAKNVMSILKLINDKPNNNVSNNQTKEIKKEAIISPTTSPQFFQ